MGERSIIFSGSVSIHAVYHTPDAGADASRGVVFVHGWSGYGIGPHRMFVNAARKLAACGFHCLRLDLGGRGDSDGNEETVDLDQMIADTLSAVRLLRRQGVREVYIVGICSGGNVALGAASLDKSIAGLALWSTPLFAPFKSRTDELRRTVLLLAGYARKALQRQTWARLLAGKIHFRLIGRILFRRNSPRDGVPARPAPGNAPSTEPARPARNPKDSRRDVMKDLVGYHGPMLFIYGSADDEAAGAPEFYRQFCSEHHIPNLFYIIDGANHSFYSLQWERDVIDKTVGWLTGQTT